MSAGGWFGTDHGPACTCGSTVWRYMQEGERAVCECVACNREEVFKLGEVVETATRFRQLHEGHHETRHES